MARFSIPFDGGRIEIDPSLARALHIAPSTIYRWTGRYGIAAELGGTHLAKMIALGCARIVVIARADLREAA